MSRRLAGLGLLLSFLVAVWTAIRLVKSPGKDGGGTFILTSANEKCTRKLLPFPSFCKQCPERGRKPHCFLEALDGSEVLQKADLLLFVDDDLVLSPWTEAQIQDVMDHYNKSILVSPERSLWPLMHNSGQIRYSIPTGEDIYPNSGLIVGRPKDLRVMLLDMIKRYTELEMGAPFDEPSWFSETLWVKNDDDKYRDQGLLNLYVNDRYNTTFALDYERRLGLNFYDILKFPCSSRTTELKFNAAFGNRFYCKGELPGLAKFSLFSLSLRSGADRVGWCLAEHPPGQLICDDLFWISDSCGVMWKGRSANAWLPALETELFSLHTSSNNAKVMFRHLVSLQMDKCVSPHEWTYL